MSTPNITPLTDSELHERYDQMLDEVWGDTKIAGYTYQTSSALKEVDPIVYRVGFSNWLDSELGETIEEHAGEYYDKAEFDAARDTDPS